MIGGATAPAEGLGCRSGIETALDKVLPMSGLNASGSRYGSFVAYAPKLLI